MTKFGISKFSDSINYILITPDILNAFFSWSILVNTLLPLALKGYDLTKAKRILVYLAVFSVILFSIYQWFINSNYFLEIIVLSLTLIPNILFSFTLLEAQSNKDFIFTSLANFIYNLGVILSLVFLQEDLIFMSISILTFTVIRYYLSKFYNKTRFYKQNQGHKKVDINFIVLSIFAQTGIGLLTIIDKFFISRFEAGTLTIYSFSEKIIYAPITIVLVAYLQANYPLLIENENKNNFVRKVRITFSVLTVFIFTALYILAMVANPLMSWLNVPENYNSILPMLKNLNIVTIPYSIFILMSYELLAKRDYKLLLITVLLVLFFKLYLLNIYGNTVSSLINLSAFTYIFASGFIFFAKNEVFGSLLRRRTFKNN